MDGWMTLFFVTKKQRNLQFTKNNVHEVAELEAEFDDKSRWWPL